MYKRTRQSVKNAKILNSLYPGAEGVLKNDNTRTVDLSTRKSRSEALVLSFLAEHSLFLSLAPEIIELSKTLAWDSSALDSLEMSRTTASYKLKFGLAKTIKEEQIRELKNSFFSLNIDESTNKASESILAILVQYYSEKEEKIILRHLASLKLPAGNADSIFNAIVSLIGESE